jgi:HAD superfamily phosphatase (TIGR01668 family)
MEKYLPDIYQETIYDINYKNLKEHGIKCLLFDLDNTIAPFNEKVLKAEVKELFYQLKQLGFKIIIYSNSPKIRVKQFGQQLNVDIYSGARKPSTKGFNKILAKYKH